MALNLVYSVKLHDLRPVIWYGQPVYQRNASIKHILRQRLGEEYAHFISEPVISEAAIAGNEDARWFCENMPNARPLSEIETYQQDKILNQIQTNIKKISQLAEQLKADPSPELQQLGELLSFCIEIPSAECILVSGEQVCLVAWGFTSDVTKKYNFRLSSYINDRTHSPSIPTRTKIITPPLTTSHPPEQPPSSNWGKWLALLFLIGFILVALYFLGLFNTTEKQNTVNPPALSPNLPEMKTDYPGDIAQRKIVSNRLIVIIKPSINQDSFTQILKNIGSSARIIGYEAALSFIQLEVDASQRESLKNKLEQHQDVEMVIYDSFLKNTYHPNDPDIKEDNKAYWLRDSKAFSAWDISRGSHAIKIAVLDQSFDLQHPELKNQYTHPYNVITHSQQLSQTQQTHGNHVAGIIAAQADNQFGLSGVCPHCQLVPVQIGKETGKISTSNLVSGLLYAIKQDIQVINLSLGIDLKKDIKALPEQEKADLFAILRRTTKKEAQFWQHIFSYIAQQNIIIVQAAGNDNMPIDVDPMKRNSHTIIVTAVDQKKQKATFSNYGNQGDISAFGVKIYSSVTQQKFAYANGTSMAAPIVSGAIGLMLSIRPNLDLTSIKTLLRETSIPVLTDNIPPLLQLDKLMQAVSVNHQQLQSCEDEKQVLTAEIERLQALLSQTPQILKLPKAYQKTLRFAAGSWRSSRRFADGTQFSFKIKRKGGGTLILSSPTNTTCHIPVSIKYRKQILTITQPKPSNCPPDFSYTAHKFICTATKNATTQCQAYQQGKPTGIAFYLFKDKG